MGKHSLQDERAFWRSVMMFSLKWLVVLAVPLLAVWGVWRLVNQPGDSPVAPGAVTIPSPQPEEVPPAEESPIPEPPVQEEPPPSPGNVDPDAESRGEVQVLNGSGISGQATVAGERLTEAGFDVVSVQNAARNYEKTVVFYKPGFEQMAIEVAEILGTSEIEPAPSNLTRPIPVTAVVGSDFEE